MRNSLLACCAALAAALLVCGCSTPLDYYESAISEVHCFDLPDSGDVEDAMEDFEDAIRQAKEDLLEDEDVRTACHHDETAYMIPLSRLGKAALHNRFNQVTSMESECWAAIKDAEKYLGAHIRKLNPSGRGGGLLFASYSVYFRREKIRRHAFTLLKEAYRAAGEKDLEALMRVQIGLSDIYLRSPTAHGEEGYIRTIENSDWMRLYKLEKEDIGHGVQMFFMALAMAAQSAAHQMQRQQLQQQSMMTNDPALKANLQQQMAMLDLQMQQNMQQNQEALQKMEEAHQASIQGIQNRFQNTVVGSIMANFALLDLSDEVKHLPSFQQVQQRKQVFDQYVLNRGFDHQTAQALVDLRTSLDGLTQELQQQRSSMGR